MKIIAISDLHGDLPHVDNLPAGDLLIVAGDILPDDYTPQGGGEVGTSRIDRQALWFFKVLVPWCQRLPYADVIMIPGNHDFYFQAIIKDGIQRALPKNVHYLHEQAITIGGVNFYGAGWNCTKGWAFAQDEEMHAAKLARVPTNIDVMIVHGPPHGSEALFHYTSEVLRDWLIEHPKKAFICGHIHEAYGQYDVGTTPVYVVCAKDRNYKSVNAPVEITIENPTASQQHSPDEHQEGPTQEGDRPHQGATSH